MGKNSKIRIGRELILSFSNESSLLSSKKIERFFVFIVCLTLTCIYVSKNWVTIKPLDFVQIIGMWVIYGGYNSAMTLKDKKLTAQTEQMAADHELEEESKKEGDKKDEVSEEEEVKARLKARQEEGQ